jgi:hypothetical protein
VVVDKGGNATPRTRGSGASGVHGLARQAHPGAARPTIVRVMSLHARG